MIYMRRNGERVVTVRGCKQCPCLRGDWTVGLRCALDEGVRFTPHVRVGKEGAPCPLVQGPVLLQRRTNP